MLSQHSLHKWTALLYICMYMFKCTTTIVIQCLWDVVVCLMQEIFIRWSSTKYCANDRRCHCGCSVSTHTLHGVVYVSLLPATCVPYCIEWWGYTVCIVGWRRPGIEFVCLPLSLCVCLVLFVFVCLVVLPQKRYSVWSEWIHICTTEQYIHNM